MERKIIGDVEEKVINFLFDKGKTIIEEIENGTKGSETEIREAIANLWNRDIVKRDGYYLAQRFLLTRKGKKTARRIKKDRVN